MTQRERVNTSVGDSASTGRELTLAVARQAGGSA